MIIKDIKDVKQAQLAVFNFVAAQRYLHPIDMSGMTIMLVLIESGWGEAAGENEKQRILLIKKFFEDCAKENCSRAARREPPLSYEQARARWVRCVAAMFPQYGIAAVSQQMAAMGGGGRPGAGGRSGTGGSGKQGNQQLNQHSNAMGVGVSSGVTKAGGTKYTPARFQGLPVCFGYNSTAGCRRTTPGAAVTSCTDGKTHFAHVCNYFLKATGAHCLASHPKVGNH